MGQNRARPARVVPRSEVLVRLAGREGYATPGCGVRSRAEYYFQ
jgi:hypothetical protein